VALVQEISHRERDFLNVGFEHEMSGIQEPDNRVRVIASEGFCSWRNEKVDPGR
jgi:hypothetical protein